MSHPVDTVGGVYAIPVFLGNFVVQLPVMLTLVVGLIVLASPGRRLPPRSLLLARAGLGLLLAEAIASLGWSTWLPQVITWAGPGGDVMRNVGLLSAVVSFLLAILFAAGLGLLVAALVAARDPAPPSYPPPGGGPPNAGPPGAGPPGAGPSAGL
jgi:hypothetical protein